MNNTTNSAALQAIEKEKTRSKNLREGASICQGPALPCFDWTQFELWMRATCEGSDQIRVNNDNDSESDGDSDSD